ncbi:tail fiber domain-containing protein [Bradyrhizobium acaciae]|uniref:tail fiber domain-containing protein n=1 Tax=Bradyrhizobium acaciae TaxID=2683706 RepID=UPI001E364937|nr:tail fiber domain-containing protein [Bradyrhizobium acaciae]MCC8977589.1 tail fiber domain-containing protein [Bradyrhizobium acaciae]
MRISTAFFGKLFMRTILPLCLLLAACQTDQPTVQNPAALQAAREGRCANVGLRRGSPEFLNCVAGYEAADQHAAIIQKQQADSQTIQGGMAGAGAALTALSLFAAFSDERLKRDIVPYGVENGFQTYRFRYLWSDDEYVGVLAQEVRRTRPDAVIHDRTGYLKVNYHAIGVSFRRLQ